MERAIVEAATRLRRHGEAHLIATVVATDGAAYRRPGARLILTRFRWVAGTATGAVLEGGISNTGWARTQDGPAVVRYDATATELVEDEDIRSAFGLGGDGDVEVLLERAGLPGRIDALEVAARCFRAQQAGAVATVFRSSAPGVSVGGRMALVAGGELEVEADRIDAVTRDAIGVDLRLALDTGATANRTYATPDGVIEALIEIIVPPPRLFLFGTGHDAVPVAQLAHQIGWDVIVCAARPRFSTRGRFAMADEVVVGPATALASRVAAAHRAIAVVMSHEAERDREVLEMLRATRAHVLLLGPRSDAPDPRIRIVEHGDNPQRSALAMILLAQSAVVPATDAPVRDASERPLPSRPSAVFAAVAAL